MTVESYEKYIGSDDGREDDLDLLQGRRSLLQGELDLLVNRVVVRISQNPQLLQALVEPLRRHLTLDHSGAPLVAEETAFGLPIPGDGLEPRHDLLAGREIAIGGLPIPDDRHWAPVVARKSAKELAAELMQQRPRHRNQTPRQVETAFGLVIPE